MVCSTSYWLANEMEDKVLKGIHFRLCVTVGNCKSSFFVGDMKVNGGGAPDVAVHDSVFGMIVQDASDCIRVCFLVQHVIARNVEYASAEAMNLPVEVAFSIRVNKEIELDLASIHGSIDVHDEGFGAGSIHGSYDMKYADQMDSS